MIKLRDGISNDCNTVEEMEAVKDLLKELGMANNSPLTLFSDSQGVVFVANNPLFKASSTLLWIHISYVKECI